MSVIKEIIKKVIPLSLLQYYRSKRVSKTSKAFKDNDLKEVFGQIYTTNHWGSSESISGTGSVSGQTEILIKELNIFFRKKGIQSILDIPCGDMNWMYRVELAGMKYIGADIVDSLIKNNRFDFSDKSNFSFEILDLTNDVLPTVDIIFCRDCLVHLSYEDIYKAFRNIKRSGSKFLLTTSFNRHNKNYDIHSGDWRTLNLERKPFNLPKPLFIIDEKCTEGQGEFKDKMMCLWYIKDLPTD